MIKISDRIISKEHINCRSLTSKSIGMMFKWKVNSPLIFYFDTEDIIPLHMFFVFTPIDVLYLNSKKIIVELKEDFKPFTIYNPKNKAKYIIELAPNTIKKDKIKIGQTIKFS